VKSKKPVAPISQAMKVGDEPLRSFSDLMQFYESKRTTPDVPEVVENMNDLEAHPASETAPAIAPAEDTAATSTADEAKSSADETN
jgi:hypothetical protein